MEKNKARELIEYDLTKGLSPSNALRPVIREFTQMFEGPIPLHKGQHVITKGDSHKNLFFILDGVIAEIGRDEQGGLYIPSAYESLQWCTNMETMLTGKKAQQSYVCLTPTLIMQVNASVIEELALQAGKDELVFILNQRFLNHVRSHFFRLLHNSPKQHYAWMKENAPLSLQAFTRDQLAAYLGIGRATLFRMLKTKGS